MAKIHLTLLLTIGILHAPNAFSEFYSCKDKEGHTITSDRPMPECKDKATQVYSSTGALKKQISSTLTPEQQRAAELQEQQRKNEAQQQETVNKEKLYLIAHYPTEHDVELARQKGLSEIKDKIASENRLIKETTEALTRNQNEQKLIPKNESNKLIETRTKEFSLMQTIKQSNSLIQRYATDETNLNRQFDEIHKHYVEIVIQSTKKPDPS